METTKEQQVAALLEAAIVLGQEAARQSEPTGSRARVVSIKHALEIIEEIIERLESGTVGI